LRPQNQQLVTLWGVKKMHTCAVLRYKDAIGGPFGPKNALSGTHGPKPPYSDLEIYMPRVASCFCLISLGLLAACSNFDRRWDSSSTPPAANPSALLDGKWEGTWQSDVNDYHGKIRAIALHQTETIVDKKLVKQYECAFRMYWFEIPFDEFTATLNATDMDDGRLHFEGKKDVGFYKGGTIRYDGFVFPKKDEMYCDYASDKDAGTYKMRRILKENQ
jgi:hypothetical protein